MKNVPVMIHFVPGSRISELTQLQQELHAFVSFNCGHQIPLPADQIVYHEDAQGAVRIGLGGMSFEGLENDQLVFWRVRDLYPEDTLPPLREMKLVLDPKRVASVHLEGRQVWPKTRASTPPAC